METSTAMTRKKSEDRREAHTVWVGEKDRIASFHAVGTYELRTFDHYDFFLKYLCALQERGFRFQ